ncbi:translation initiation factor IF-2 subunit beta [archaeon]|jgi:putative translation initiation factor aIF-2 beta subunit|nr:translation initiation factor IF-2 subunit beta [archaeon]MBT6182434.1 translation initiation factor IF-2 subunit beta [archaeon]MBT6606335.1 translation initiation factor IF-2 subunit beta [archaeon]MBT7251496.1 translation initiation factor IF-2 subunit beta [archaeon]MBT7660761.1 translation initiation factor IF-2 subunit beta [archaeon]
MDYETLLDEAYQTVKPVDVCERFEIIKVSGHHEGIRTIISNFSQVAACMRRPAAHIMKFLSKELASSAEISRDRLLLSRKLASKDINAKIEKYANSFVLCKACKKPDTELMDEANKTFLKCLACGNKQEIHKI